jgi:predicted SAM-dependent methyltransferase
MQNSLRKLHLGCGDVRLKGWVNIDLDTPTADMNIDLTLPLPFADNSVSHIFSEHFIEHITRQQAVSFLAECKRTLSEHGVMRISTPNLKFLATLYLAGIKDEWGELWQPSTTCQMLNEVLTSWGHQFVYDAQEIVSILIEAGFNSICFQGYRKSQDSSLCDLESRPFKNELIIEAKVTANKPIFVDYDEINLSENIFWLELDSKFLGIPYCSIKHNADQENRIRNLETELATINYRVIDQVNHIRNLEAELLTFKNSLYGRAKYYLYKFFYCLRINKKHE